MTIQKLQLRMLIIDVLRHGGGAHFDGFMARLNNDGCIGWRNVFGRDFSANEVRSQIQQMILDGDVILESMWDGRGVLSKDAALESEWNANVLISNSDKALADWEKWDPPVSN